MFVFCRGGQVGADGAKSDRPCRVGQVAETFCWIFVGRSWRLDSLLVKDTAEFGMFALMAGYVAALIKERTQAGLQAARARGRRGGRKPKMTRN